MMVYIIQLTLVIRNHKVGRNTCMTLVVKVIEQMFHKRTLYCDSFKRLLEKLYQ